MISMLKWPLVFGFTFGACLLISAFPLSAILFIWLLMVSQDDK